jgi:O-antigen ligase
MIMHDAFAHEQAEGASRAVRIFALVLLVACWTQFTSAWFWPPVRIVNQGTIALYENKPFAAPFQYLLWAAVVLGAFLVLRRQGLVLGRRLGIFGPYLILMVSSSAVGIAIFASLRLTALWALCVLAGGVVALLLERQTLVRALAVVTLGTMTLSLLMYLLLPEYGSDRYHGEQVLRGVFDHKNTAGRMASVAFVLVFSLGRALPAPLLVSALVASAVCLLLSESKAAIAASLMGAVYLTIMKPMARRVSGGLGALTVAVALLAGFASVLLLAPFLTEAIGRDVTLTGRTTVWEVYLQEIRSVLVLGAGPGSFTAISPVTVKLAFELRAIGSIFSPHNFMLGTLGDLGILGLTYTIVLFAFFAVVLPLRSDCTFAWCCAAVSVVTMLHGMGETLDAGTAGITWFLLSLLWTAHLTHTVKSENLAMPSADGHRMNGFADSAATPAS